MLVGMWLDKQAGNTEPNHQKKMLALYISVSHEYVRLYLHISYVSYQHF